MITESLKLSDVINRNILSPCHRVSPSPIASLKIKYMTL